MEKQDVAILLPGAARDAIRFDAIGVDRDRLRARGEVGNESFSRRKTPSPVLNGLVSAAPLEESAQTQTQQLGSQAHDRGICIARDFRGAPTSREFIEFLKFLDTALSLQFVRPAAIQTKAFDRSILRRKVANRPYTDGGLPS